MKAETKYKGSIKLAAIGDALGWITEFEKNKENIKTKYGTDYITSFFNWEKNVGGRFNGYLDKICSGSYSDDTQLMLSVSRSINNDGTVNNDYFSKVELINWLLYSRGAGRTIKNAAKKISRKSAKWNDNFFTYKAGDKYLDYRQAGANGAAMRILPIALANFGDIDKINKEIFSNSIITHGHPRAILGAMIYGYAINTILRFLPSNFNSSNFLIELGKNILSKFSISFIDDSDFILWENKWNKDNIKPFRILFEEVTFEAQEYLRNIYKFVLSGAPDVEVISKLGCYNKETKGSGISTVLAGIYFTCKYSDNPLKGIEEAVNSIGTDTDSIAAFTGGLLGALHGQSIIPQKWKKVQDFDYLDKISLRLLNISECKKLPSNSIEEKSFINLTNIISDTLKKGDTVFLKSLGTGKVVNLERQRAITKGKYNLIFDVDFDIGQSCRFAKLLRTNDNNENEFLNENKSISDEMLKELNLDFQAKKKIEQFSNNLSSEDKDIFNEIIEIIDLKLRHINK